MIHMYMMSVQVVHCIGSVLHKVLCVILSGHTWLSRNPGAIRRALATDPPKGQQRHPATHRRC